MAYFDGIKVGDTIYDWEKPVVVDRIMNSPFGIHIKETDVWISRDGKRFYGSVQECFWQPVTPPVPPPRPKRKVTKYIEVYKMAGVCNDNHWEVNKSGNGDTILRDQPCGGIYPEMCIYAYAPIEVEE
jgi:hypothetical protein